jgi:phosphoribosyl 1,2-cyclic phosphodiesterase
MPVCFTTLASGSGGNASLVKSQGPAVLIDFGLGPRQLSKRFNAIGTAWPTIGAVVLTHTHGDHWADRTLAYLRRLRIPLYCHTDHHLPMQAYGNEFAGLRAAGLVHTFEVGETFRPAPGLTCRAFPVSHDGATFGFRFEGQRDLFGPPTALGYAADLGSWTPELAATLAEVDLLALEFNHDVHLQKNSGRAPFLIRRNLGDRGHLSNDQAADLVAEILRLSPRGRLRNLVQLHLSRDCNRPDLARAAAAAVLADDAECAIHTASQHEPGPTLEAGQSSRRVRRAVRPRRPARAQRPVHPWLPGLGP